MEHIERAGVHSGDSACALPPKSIPRGRPRRDPAPDHRLGKALERRRPDEHAVRGAGQPRVCPRSQPAASRTVPFVSKAIGVPLAKIAARVMGGKTSRNSVSPGNGRSITFRVKEAVFPFIKFPGVDTCSVPR